MARGKKYDQGKNRVDLLDIRALEEIARVLTYGAKKYSEENWKLVPNLYRRYYGALLRHIFAWMRGERVDKETKITHLAHAGACILFLLGAEMSGIQKENQPKLIKNKVKHRVRKGRRRKHRSNK
jgi:hypothetical protein